MLFSKFGLFLSGILASLSLATETHIQTFDFATPPASSYSYYWKLSTDSVLPNDSRPTNSFNEYFDISVNLEGTQASCPGTSLFSLSTQGLQLFTIQSGTPIDYSAAWALDDTTLYAAASRMEVSYEPTSNDSLFLYLDRQDNFHLCQILKSRRHSACAYISTNEPVEYTGFDSLTVSCESALDSSPRFKEPASLAIWSPDARKAQRPLYLPHGEIRLPADEQVLSLIDPSGAAVPYNMKRYADQSQSVIPLASGNRILWLVASRQGQARLYRIAPSTR